MQTTQQEIIDFAIDLAKSFSLPWARDWSIRTIDGFFYFRFINKSLETKIGETRQEAMGRSAPPYPWRWSDLKNRPVWYSLPAVGQKNHDDETDGWIARAGLAWEHLSSVYAVPDLYLEAAFLHGTPVPFGKFDVNYTSVEAGKGYRVYDSRRVKIYSTLTAKAGDWKQLREWYESAPVYGLKPPFDSYPGVTNGAVRYQFIETGIPYIEIEALAPHASASVLEANAREAYSKYASGLSGSKTHAKKSIVTWATYLLSRLCGITQREAMQITNDTLAGLCKKTKYKIGPKPNETQQGEIRFSGDEKPPLEARIAYYDARLG